MSISSSSLGPSTVSPNLPPKERNMKERKEGGKKRWKKNQTCTRNRTSTCAIIKNINTKTGFFWTNYSLLKSLETKKKTINLSDLQFLLFFILFSLRSPKKNGQKISPTRFRSGYLLRVKQALFRLSYWTFTKFGPKFKSFLNTDWKIFDFLVKERKKPFWHLSLMMVNLRVLKKKKKRRKKKRKKKKKKRNQTAQSEDLPLVGLFLPLKKNHKKQQHKFELIFLLGFGSLLEDLKMAGIANSSWIKKKSEEEKKKKRGRENLKKKTSARANVSAIISSGFPL